MVAGVTVCAISFWGCASNSDGSPSTEAPTTTMSVEQLDYIDCVDTLTDAVMQMSIVGGDHDGGFQSVVRAFGTESEEMDLVRALLLPTTQQGVDEGIDVTLAALSPKVQEGCARIHPGGVVALDGPAEPAAQSEEERIAECSTVVLGSMIDAFNRSTDGVDEPDGEMMFADIFTTYGGKSVENTVVHQLWNDFVFTGLEHGLDAALEATDTEAACAAGYHGAGIDGPDATGPSATDAAKPRPASTSTTVGSTAEPGATISTASTTHGALDLSAGSVGGVQLGQELGSIKTTIDGLFGSTGDGPWRIPTCTTNDATISWVDGLTISFDPDQRMYGYTFSDLSPGGGPGWAPAIDLAGSGLGWGATPDEISAAVPNYSLDPLLGDMIIELDDGLLQLQFEQGGLTRISVGDMCSPGGQQTDATPETTSPPGCPVGGIDVLREGDGSSTPCPSVRDAQNFLSRYGYAVTADGRFGPTTTAAVRQFQADNGLDVDGLIGKNTWALLAEADLWDA